MRDPRHAAASLVIVAVAGLAAAQAAQEQAPVFRTRGGIVTIPAVVRDQQGRLATTLQATDFEVRDDGVVVPISVFAADPQPVTLLLLFDTSASGLDIADVRRAATAAVAALGDGDRARIGTFGREIAVSPHLTGDRAILSRVIREEIWPGISSRVWEAITAGLMTLSRDPGNRRTLLVLSDGRDTTVGARPTTPADVQALARRENWQVYAVTPFSSIDRAMQQLVDDTGGQVVRAGRSSNLPAVYAAVLDELRHQYLLGFASDKNDGAIHRIEVRARQSGYRVTARQTYEADGRR